MLIRGLFTLLCCLLASPAWAFPDNGVLDTFTGADATSPPNSNWTNGIDAATGMDLEDNAVTTSLSGNYGSAYWNPTTFNADQEAYATIVNATSLYTCLYARLVNIGTGSTDGYFVCANDATNTPANVLKINRDDNGVSTLLGATISQTVTVGDKLGMTAIGDQICAWYKVGAGAWASVGCRTDATYSAGGKLGLATAGNAAVGTIDDFGGGNVTTTVPAAPTALHLAGADSATSATFIWAPNTESDLTGYKVYVGTVSGQTNTLVKTITAASAAASHSSMTIFRHRRPVAGTRYYTIVAYNPTGDSAKSSEISSTVAGLSARTPRTTFTKRKRIP